MSTYYLVQGDTGTQVRVEIRRQSDRSLQDISAAETRLYFRNKSTKQMVTTLFNLAPAADREAGVAIFAFGEGDLDIDPGFYEGEIEVRYANGGIETVYQNLDFYLREDYA